MLEHNAAKWGDKVRICGISIDNDIATVNNHVKAKKWESVEHFHRGGSSASEDFGASGVPHVVLLDTHGKVVFIGHPATRDLEKDINELLEGKTLSGEGTTAKGGDAKEGKDGNTEGYEDINIETVYTTMSNYASKINDLLGKDEVKAHA